MSLAENNYVQYHHRAALVVLAGVSAANRTGTVVGRESAGARAEAGTAGTTLSLTLSLALLFTVSTFLALFSLFTLFLCRLFTFLTLFL